MYNRLVHVFDASLTDREEEKFMLGFPIIFTRQPGEILDNTLFPGISLKETGYPVQIY